MPSVVARLRDRVPTLAASAVAVLAIVLAALLTRFRT